MGKVIMSGIVPQLTVPSAGTPISQFAEGSIVKVNENGSPVEFYIAKHDYESNMNGSGMILLLRKDCYTTLAWDSGSVNAYDGSDIDLWFSNTYKAVLDESVQSSINTTKIYYTIGNGNTSIGTIERQIFALSATELGNSGNQNVLGTALDIADSCALRIAHLNGSTVKQWTRSALSNGNTTNAICFYEDGNVYGNNCSGQLGVRPAFTLPSTALVKDDGTVKGAA